MLVCTTCRTPGNIRKVNGGSGIIEFILLVMALGMSFIGLMFFIFLPFTAIAWGLFIVYGIFRVSSRTKSCGACGSASLVPMSSPAGRDIVPNQTVVDAAAEKLEWWPIIGVTCVVLFFCYHIFIKG